MFLSPQSARYTGYVETPEVGFDSFLQGSLSQGLNDTVFGSIWRMSELEAAKDHHPDVNPFISKDEANEDAKIEGLDLHFDHDPTLDEYILLSERKRNEQTRQFQLQGAENNLQKAAGLGVGLLASISNPLDLTLSFIPIAGTGAKAASVAKGASTFSRLRTGVNNVYRSGLVPGINPGKTAIGKLGVAALEGTAGSLVVEIPLAISNSQDQAQYTAKDFFFNVGAGGAFNTALRGVFMGFGRLMRSINPEISDSMMLEARQQFLTDDEIDIHGFLELDENVQNVRAQEELQSQVVREAQIQLGEIDDRPTRIDIKAVREQAVKKVGPLDEFITRVQDEANTGPLLDEPVFGSRDPYVYTVTDSIDQISEIKSGGLDDFADSTGAGLFFGLDVRGTDAQQRFNDGAIIRVNKETIRQGFEPDVVEFDETLRDVQIIDDEAIIEPENLEVLTPDGWKLITEAEEVIPSSEAPTPDRQQIEEKAKSLRQDSIKRFIEDAKRKFETQQKRSQEYRQELERIVEQGRVLKEAELKKQSVPQDISQREISKLDEDIASLEGELRGDQDKFDDSIYGDIKPEDQDSLSAAVDCLVNNG